MDLDGVVYPFIEAWHRCAYANGFIDKDQITSTVNSWDFHNDYGLSAEAFRQTLPLWTNEGLYSFMQPNSNNVADWQWIYENSYLHVITTRHPKAKKATDQWLHFWGMPYHRLSVIGNSVSKASQVYNPVGRELIAVDDLESNLIDYEHALEGVETLLYAQPYNIKDDFGRTRVNSLYEVRRLMEHGR